MEWKQASLCVWPRQKFQCMHWRLWRNSVSCAQQYVFSSFCYSEVFVKVRQSKSKIAYITINRFFFFCPTCQNFSSHWPIEKKLADWRFSPSQTKIINIVHAYHYTKPRSTLNFFLIIWAVGEFLLFSSSHYCVIVITMGWRVQVEVLTMIKQG